MELVHFSHKSPTVADALAILKTRMLTCLEVLVAYVKPVRSRLDDNENRPVPLKFRVTFWLTKRDIFGAVVIDHFV